MAKDPSLNGAVSIEFDITTKGKVDDLYISPGSRQKTFNDFVTKMIQSYPGWEIAYVNGVAVYNHYFLTVAFPDINLNCFGSK